MNKTGKAEVNWERYLSFNLKLVLMAMAAITFYKSEYTWFVWALGALLLSFAPAILKHDFNVKLPIVLDFAITVSIFLHVIGGYLNLYYTIPYYDHLTHFLSSATIALLSVTLLYVMAFNFKIIKFPPVGFGILVIFTTMSMGVIWEFMEWGSDMMLGTNLQWGLHDTMMDLFFDTIAGVLVATVAVMRLKVGDYVLTESLVEVGDVRNSIGYRRWRELSASDRKLARGILRSFKDPVMMDGIIKYIVNESNYVTEAQREAWKATMGEDEGT